MDKLTDIVRDEISRQYKSVRQFVQRDIKRLDFFLFRLLLFFFALGKLRQF